MKLTKNQTTTTNNVKVFINVRQHYPDLNPWSVWNKRCHVPYSNPSAAHVVNNTRLHVQDSNPPAVHVLHLLKSNTNCSRKLQNNKKYIVIRHGVLIPCTKKKLPASVRVHFSTATTTTTPTVTVTRLIRHRSHLLRKSWKILNAA